MAQYKFTEYFEQEVLRKRRNRRRLKMAPYKNLCAKRLEADMASPKWQAVIAKNRALARELGISGTPGFIVGNELVPGWLDLNG